VGRVWSRSLHTSGLKDNAYDLSPPFPSNPRNNGTAGPARHGRDPRWASRPKDTKGAGARGKQWQRTRRLTGEEEGYRLRDEAWRYDVAERNPNGVTAHARGLKKSVSEYVARKRE
jgi:hypothetical protein